jgi:hypothetical protein
VPSAEALHHAIRDLVGQGFIIRASTPYDAHLYKAKRFQPIWAVIGVALCILPLLIYLLVYLVQQDQSVYVVVQTRLPQPAPPPPVAPRTQPYWDGNQWVVPER